MMKNKYLCAILMAHIASLYAKQWVYFYFFNSVRTLIRTHGHLVQFPSYTTLYIPTCINSLIKNSTLPDQTIWRI